MPGFGARGVGKRDIGGVDLATGASKNRRKRAREKENVSYRENREGRRGAAWNICMQERGADGALARLNAKAR